MLLTKAAVIAYAMACGHLDYGAADMMAITAWKESKYDTSAIGRPARDGLSDYGLYQIHPTNFANLGLTYQTVMDPCEASRAAATWFKILSVYNSGNERTSIMNGYASDTYANRHNAAPTIAIPEPLASSAPMEPVPINKGAQQIMVFSGWSK